MHPTRQPPPPPPTVHAQHKNQPIQQKRMNTPQLNPDWFETDSTSREIHTSGTGDSLVNNQSIILSFDPGWFFLIAGLILITAAVLIPPTDDLTSLTNQRHLLLTNEQHSIDQLEAYSNFLGAVETEDPDLVRRLSAADLNRIPESSIPIAMIGSQLDVSIDRWIIDTLPNPNPIPTPPHNTSMLHRLCTGPYRLWTLATGAILTLIGLLPKGLASPSRLGS